MWKIFLWEYINISTYSLWVVYALSLISLNSQNVCSLTFIYFITERLNAHNNTWLQRTRWRSKILTLKYARQHKVYADGWSLKWIFFIPRSHIPRTHRKWQMLFARFLEYVVKRSCAPWNSFKLWSFVRRIGKKKQKSWWVRSWIARRNEFGTSDSLLIELRDEDPDCNLFRIDKRKFEKLLHYERRYFNDIPCFGRFFWKFWICIQSERSLYVHTFHFLFFRSASDWCWNLTELDWFTNEFIYHFWFIQCLDLSFLIKDRNE